jgi:hypothetical protein
MAESTGGSAAAAAFTCGEMLIVVKFRPRRDATEVVLVHAQLSSEQAGDNRRNGCAGCFPKLEQVLVKRGAIPAARTMRPDSWQRGLDPLTPKTTSSGTGPVTYRARLGGMFRSCHREAA